MEAEAEAERAEKAAARKEVAEEVTSAVSSAVVGVGAFAVDTVLAYAAAVADEAAAKQEEGSRRRQEIERLRSSADGLRQTIGQVLSKEQKVAEARERASRLAHCVPELELLGLSTSNAADLDEKVLRRAFRHASKALHPDVAPTHDDHAEGYGDERTPTIYDLNRAYEVLRLML
mmetsp:Transcript_32592/g.83083  ORF Transcript_32592/g.83083 Transcript_32592/m.83083 type:complete len:175 (+) Transcript_32592:3-527(+)